MTDPEGKKFSERFQNIPWKKLGWDILKATGIGAAHVAGVVVGILVYNYVFVSDEAETAATDNVVPMTKAA
jgi:uncharacterized protein (DUF2062 family)